MAFEDREWREWKVFITTDMRVSLCVRVTCGVDLTWHSPTPSRRTHAYKMSELNKGAISASDFHPKVN